MQMRWRIMLLAIAVAATFVIGGVAVATSPRAQAQSAPTGDSGDGSCPSSNAPNELVLSGGTPQTAQLDSAFTNPLQVALANTNGCPVTTNVTGTAVTFSAPSSGPSATFGASGSIALTLGTDATGSASVQMLVANDTAGAFTVTASCAYGSVSFSLTNTAAGIAATITPLAPSTQHASVDGRYAQPLAVRVLDANGNPVIGANVTFSLGSAGGAGGGSAAAAGATFDDGTSQAGETTDSNGVATSPGMRANAASGAFTATASVQHVTEPARFTLDNRAVKLQAIASPGPHGRTARVGTRYAHRLQVRLRTASGSPVQGATVTFTLGSSSAAGGASTGSGGAGASFAGGSTEATATTGPRGIATSPRLTANDQAGAWTAQASASGADAVALFHLHNGAGAPSTITAGVGSAQSTTTGTRFAIPLSVTVSDAHGNRATDVPVTFTAPSSGPGATFAGGLTKVTVRTNSSGVAIAPPTTANGQAGGYVVTASVKGVRQVAFALVNTSA
jgi:adhesin/invasin